MIRGRVIGGAICAAASLFASLMDTADMSMLPAEPKAVEAGQPRLWAIPVRIKLD